MRLCDHLGCDETATVYYHGSWCGTHALQRYGTTPALEHRFSELRSVAAPEHVAAPAPGRSVPVRNPFPPADGPAPLSDGDLERLLATNGWDLMDLEWAIVDALEDTA